jgi:hypothetical protein
MFCFITVLGEGKFAPIHLPMFCEAYLFSYIRSSPLCHRIKNGF